jgi:hypothetical protein
MQSTSNEMTEPEQPKEDRNSSPSFHASSPTRWSTTLALVWATTGLNVHAPPARMGSNPAHSSQVGGILLHRDTWCPMVPWLVQRITSEKFEKSHKSNLRICRFAGDLLEATEKSYFALCAGPVASGGFVAFQGHVKVLTLSSSWHQRSSTRPAAGAKS